MRKLKPSIECIDLRKNNQAYQDSVAYQKKLERLYVGDGQGYWAAIGRGIQKGKITHIFMDDNIRQAMDFEKEDYFKAHQLGAPF